MSEFAEAIRGGFIAACIIFIVIAVSAWLGRD